MPKDALASTSPEEVATTRLEEETITDWEIAGVQRWLADDFAHICLEMRW